MYRATTFIVLTIAATWLMPTGVASAAFWQGGTGNWTDDNWGLDAPDGHPGDANYPAEQALITATNSNITVNSVIPNAINFQPRAGVLTVTTGGSLSAPAAVNVETGSATGSTLNVNGGTVNIAHGFGYGRHGDSDLNISSGIFNYSAASGGGRFFEFRNNSGAGVGTVDITGSGSLIATNGGTFRVTNLKTSSVHITDSGTLNQTGDYDMAGTTGISGLSHTISVTGSAASVTMGNVDAFATDSDQDAVFSFVLDGSGVSTINLNNLDLTGGDHAADLVVDANAFIGAASIDLFSYTTLTGAAFNSVTIIGGSGTIDYGTGANDTITLTLIPEPATLAMASLGMAVLLSYRCAD